MANVVAGQLTVPQAARRLRIPGEEVYGMIFAGELQGGPDALGETVFVPIEAIEAYEETHAAVSH